MTAQTQIPWKHIKAHFVMKDSSVASWCRQNDIDPANFKKIWDGSWTGPRATELLKELEKEMKEAA